MLALPKALIGLVVLSVLLSGAVLGGAARVAISEYRPLPRAAAWSLFKQGARAGAIDAAIAVLIVASVLGAAVYLIVGA